MVLFPAPAGPSIAITARRRSFRKDLGSLLSERDHEIIRGGRADILPAVLFVRGEVSDSAGAQSRSFALDGYLHGPFPDHDHLDVLVMMRRMRRFAGRELRLMAFDPQSFMRFAVEDGAPLPLESKILEGEGLGGERRVFGRGAGGGHQGGE